MVCPVVFLGKPQIENVLDILPLGMCGVIIFHLLCKFLWVLVIVAVKMRARAPGASASSIHLHLSLSPPDSELGGGGGVRAVKNVCCVSFFSEERETLFE